MRNETIRLRRQPRSANNIGIGSQEAGERLTMIDVERTALDATVRRREPCCRKPVHTRDDSKSLGLKVTRLLDGIKWQIANRLGGTDLDQVVQQRVQL